MEEDSFRDSPTRNGKFDRRGIVRKFAGTVGSKFREGSYRCIPVREDINVYEDVENEDPWKWTFGTREDDGVWLNVNDRVGTVMACLVWVLIVYSGFTFLLLAQHHHLPIGATGVYCTICTLALASHAKTTFTDPGAVPSSAIPSVTETDGAERFHGMCRICQTFKPKCAHHCRICNRCVSGMDHHCPW